MIDDNNEKDEKQVKAIFQNNIDATDLVPPPYMKTRIISRFIDIKRVRNSFAIFWKSIALTTAMAAVTLILISEFISDSFVSANIGVPLTVKVEVAELSTNQIAYTEIILPDGVSFYSQKFPEFNQKQSLLMDWEIAVKNGHLPFVIRSNMHGKKIIVLKFYDDQNRIILEKKLKINFARVST